MATFFKIANPTSGDTISSGYPTGSTWCNQVTYTKYTHISDGVWRHNPDISGVMFLNEECSKKTN